MRSTLSVEGRERPELVGRPVIVGGSPARRGVVAANHVTPSYGVHSAIPGGGGSAPVPSGNLSAAADRLLRRSLSPDPRDSPRFTP